MPVQNVQRDLHLTLEYVHVTLDILLFLLMGGLIVYARLVMGLIGEHTVVTNVVPDISKTGLETMDVHSVQQESILQLEVLNAQIVLLARVILCLLRDVLLGLLTMLGFVYVILDTTEITQFVAHVQWAPSQRVLVLRYVQCVPREPMQTPIKTLA